MDIYDLLMEESEPNAQQRARVMADALRRKQAVGDLGMLTGDKVLSNFGRAQQQRADVELGELSGAGRFRGGQALTKALAQQRQTFDAAEAQKDRGSRERMQRAALGAREGAAGAKNEAAEKKATEKAARDAAGFYLDGYDLSPESRPQDIEVRQLRDAQAQTEDIKDTVGQILDLYKKHGTEALPSEARAKMKLLVTDLQLGLKGEAAYQLGVLAGPDMKLLETVTGDPTDAKANVLSFFGDADETVPRLSTLVSKMESRFDRKAKSKGYAKKGSTGETVLAGASGGAGLDLEKPVTKVIGGKTYELVNGKWVVEE